MDQARAGSRGRYGIVPIEPWLAIKVKYFGRHKSGAIRDGVLIVLIDPPQPQPASVRWSCDTDATIAAMRATGAE